MIGKNGGLSFRTVLRSGRVRVILRAAALPPLPVGALELRQVLEGADLSKAERLGFRFWFPGVEDAAADLLLKG